MPEIKTTTTKRKKAFDGLIRTLNVAEERISELEDISVEIAELNRKNNKDWISAPAVGSA